MKLFSTKELKRKDPTDEKIREIRFLDKLIKDKAVTWNDLKQQLDPEKERLQREFVSFATNLKNKSGELLKEVTDLEDRKAKALEPLDQKQYELSLQEQELKEREITLKSSIAKLEEEKDFLMQKAIFIAEKQDEFKSLELEFDSQRKAIKTQQVILANSTTDLNNQWLTFKQNCNLRELELLEQGRKNFDKGEELKIIKQSLDKEKQDLLAQKKRLDDRQGVLERGFEELRSKNGRP